MFRDPIETSMATNLKIALVSPNKGTVDHVRSLLNGDCEALIVAPGGVEQATRVAEQERPDVLIVEGASHDETDLGVLEVVTSRHPGMGVILLSPNQSADFFRKGMRIGLREILPMPVSRQALFETIGRIQQRSNGPAHSAGKGKILSFIGCKGGSGATFLATNLGYALATQAQTKVALIDMNCQFGDASLYLSERTPSSNLADVARHAHKLDAALLESSMLQVLPNLHVLAAPEEPEQALQIRAEHIDAVLWTAASHYDVVIIDAGRSLDDVTVRAMDLSDTVFAVLQLSLPYIRDAKRLLHAMSSLGYGKDKIKLVVNRFEKRAPLSLGEVAAALGREVFRTIPNSFASVSDSVNQGIPIAKLTARDPVARALHDMAGELAAIKSAPSGGWLRSWLPGR